MFIVEAIKNLAPGATWGLEGDTYAGLQWGEDNTISKPTEIEVNAEVARLQTTIPLAQCKTEAKKRIAATDWAVLPDVGLANKSEFEAYRAQLRVLITNPVAEPTWPTEPEPVWS